MMARLHLDTKIMSLDMADSTTVTEGNEGGATNVKLEMFILDTVLVSSGLIFRGVAGLDLDLHG